LALVCHNSHNVLCFRQQCVRTVRRGLSACLTPPPSIHTPLAPLFTCPRAIEIRRLLLLFTRGQFDLKTGVGNLASTTDSNKNIKTASVHQCQHQFTGSLSSVCQSGEVVEYDIAVAAEINCCRGGYGYTRIAAYGEEWERKDGKGGMGQPIKVLYGNGNHYDALL